MAVLKGSNLPLGDQKQYTFSRKTWLDNQSECLWKIERGIVRTSVLTEAGNIITTGYWGVGDVVGYPLSEAQTCAIECVTSVEAWELGSEQWPLYVTDLLRYGQQLESFAVIGRLERTDLRLQQFPSARAVEQCAIQREAGGMVDAQLGSSFGSGSQALGHADIGQAAIDRYPVIAAAGHDVVKLEVAGDRPRPYW